MGTLIDLSGQRFGRWRVVGRVPNEGTAAAWECECECGRRRTVKGQRLRDGTSRSCGCQTTENLVEFNRVHGQHRTSTYRIWAQMVQRCTNPNAPNYRYYGGRGIRVCERWRESFANFLADMGARPDGLTLDRRDVNGDYEPKNCRWATWAEQHRNKRKKEAQNFAR